MGGVGWEDELKNKTNLSQRLVEVEAELGNILSSEHFINSYFRLMIDSTSY